MSFESSDVPSPPALPVARSPRAGRVRRVLRELGPAGPLGAVMVGLPFVGGAVLVGSIHRLGPWLKASASPGVLLLSTAAVALLAGLTLAPTYVLAVVAGWAFGLAGGLAVTTAGITAAGVVGFGVARAFARDQLRGAASQHPRTDAVRRALLESGAARAALIVALLRLAPVVPFGATNLLMASAGCRLGPFVAGTFAGSIPRTAAIVAMAARMSEPDFRQSPRLVAAGLVATVAVIVVLTVFSRKALATLTVGPATGPQRLR